MELNKKCLDIMAYLRRKQDYVTLEALSEQYGVSVRGIRYSLDKIEQYMAAHGMPYLERERRLGVRLPCDEAICRFVDSCAGSLVPFQYSYSSGERQSFLRMALLLSPVPVTVEELCRELERSRNTLFKDLEATECWLSGQGMALVKKPRVGMYVEGEEACRRQLLCELLMEGLPPDELLRYVTERQLRGKGPALLLERLLPHPRDRLVSRAIKRIEGLLDKQFSDETFATLIIQLAVTLQRAQGSGPGLVIPGEDYIPLSNEYGAAKLVLDELEGQSGVRIPEREVLYFTYHLLGAKVLKPELAGLEPAESAALEQVTRRMTAEIEELYQVELGEVREDVIRGVLLHLQPAVHRIRYGLYNKNPLYNEIVSNYNALFINTRVVCRHLEEYIGRQINDHEVAYIALHFGAGLHRINKSTSSRARVLLVCGTGLGSAKLITSQIDKLFNVEVVDTVSARMAAEMDKQDVDYVITTVPLPDWEGRPCLQVSPMFTERDVQSLGRCLSLRYIPKERYDLEVSTANRLISIVEKYCVVTDRLHLQYELLNELMNSERLSLTRREGDYRLCELLPRERVAVGVQCSDWRESITLSARPLEQQGLILPGYKEAIIRCLEEYGPYMVMLPGMALAHAGPEEGVMGLGMSLTVLADGVAFGYPEHDPVRVVVTLAALDDKLHLKALAQLFRMFKDSDSARVVFRGSKEEILEQIALHSD